MRYLGTCVIGLVLGSCAALAPNNNRDVPWNHPETLTDVTGEPRLQIVVTDPARGEGVPCKVTVRGIDGTTNPHWGTEQNGVWIDRENLALGAGQWILMARGRANVLMPPGRYQLTVSRGGEYEALNLGNVTIAPDHGASVYGEIRRVVDTAGEIAGEFHVHAEPSFDSRVPLDQRVLSLAVEGIEVFASTDHNAIGDYGAAVASLGLERHIYWVRGDEVTTDNFSNFGHFNAYPLPANFNPAEQLIPVETTVSELITRVRTVASVVQLNHPLWDEHIGYWAWAGFDPANGRSRMELYSRFDAVEVWNGHTLDQGVGAPDVDAVIDAWMATMQISRGATAMGNSDSHRVSSTPPGWPRTYVRVPDDDPSRVTDTMISTAIIAGDAMVSSGPFLRATIQDVHPGNIVRAVNNQVTVHVELQATAWTPVDMVEVVVNRERVATRTAPTTVGADGKRSASWDIPITLTRDAWVVARTRAVDPLPAMAGVHNRPMQSLALVNPIYVDVDGDGEWQPPGIGNGP